MSNGGFLHPTFERELTVPRLFGIGSCYYSLDQRLFIAVSHPVVGVKPGIPLRYQSRGWDFGWLVLLTIWHEFEVRPFDFYERNPALDLPLSR